MYNHEKPAWIRAVLALVLGLGLVGAVGAPAVATGSTGTIEICKTGTGPGVSGSFEFTVSGLAGQTFAVPVGQCSQPITVTAGQVTVTESAREGYQLAGVGSLPAGALVSSDLAARTATVTVAAGDVSNQTIVTFTNKVVEKGYLEVCKKAAAGTTLTGTFTFSVAAGSTTHTVAAPVGGCSAPLALPAGTATITEAVRSDAELTAIEVTPSGRIVGTADLATRSVTVTIVAGDLATQTIATFTNKPKPQPKGLIKVCKAATTDVPAGTTFAFTVNGAAVSVQAGSCSLPVEAAIGTAVVTEAAATGYSVSAIDVSPAAALVSKDLATRTASVTVTDSQVTEVTFTNKTAKGWLKVCKAAGRGVVAGQVFDFTVAGTSIQVQAGYCSLPMELPVGNVTVDEVVPAGYRVSDITEAGSGALVSTDLEAGSAVVTVAEGVTEVTVTNVKKPRVTGCTLTKGYFKNHRAVVAALLDASGGTLLVGGVQLTAAQIDQLFDRSSKNYLNQVSQQLMAALLNQLRGASTPTAVQTAINAAALLIDQNGGPLSGSADSQTSVVYNGVTYTASQIVAVLSSYNQGSAPGGPAHCGD